MKCILASVLTLSVLFSLAQDSEPTKIAIIGCHNQGEPAPTIPYLHEVLKPDYTVWIGDNVYADTETDPQHILDQLKVLEAKPGFKELRESSKFMVTWDDHDHGLNNAGKDYRFKEESKQIHRKFWRFEEDVPEDQDGIHHARLETQPNGKTVQFIMLDCRYNKDEPGPKADVLGENQWKWLQAQLLKPADVRFLLSGYQVLLHKPTHWEAWVRQGKSRERLTELFRTTGANNVIFITGDQHYVEVLRSPGNVKYKTFEIMAAGINKNERPGVTTNRVMAADVTIHNAPLIEIYWDDDPLIHFKNFDVENNKISSEFKFNMSQIGFKK